MTCSVEAWGTGFWESMERWPGKTEGLKTGLAAVSVARAALLRGRVERDECCRAARLLSFVSDLPLRTWAREVIREATYWADDTWPAPIADRLMRYGKTLIDDGIYAAAIDVLTVLCDSPAVDPGTALEAMERRASAIRRGAQTPNDLVYAEMAYLEFGKVAKKFHRHHYELQSRLGLATVQIMRGQYRLAHRKLQGIVRAAKNAHDVEALGDAYVLLSAIAGQRRQYGKSISYGIRATRVAQRPDIMRRAVQNIAEALERIGGDRARDFAGQLSAWLNTNAATWEERVESDDLAHRVADPTEPLEAVSPTDLAGLARLGSALSAALAAD